VTVEGEELLTRTVLKVVCRWYDRSDTVSEVGVSQEVVSDVQLER